MSQKIEALAARIEGCLQANVTRVSSSCGELTYEVAPADWGGVAEQLRDHETLRFEMLMDLCVVDYLHHGQSEWQTEDATRSGFSRGVERDASAHAHFVAAQSGAAPPPGKRYGVVCHLLSLAHNVRLRLRAFCDDDHRPMIDTLVNVWASANWYEREAFDLFGVLFRGHPDLRRLLTDYGFIGHPFRKDFPLIGEVEVRYDPTSGRVVYEPVSIEPRTLVPKVIRDDHRYEPEIHDEASYREAGNRA